MLLWIANSQTSTQRLCVCVWVKSPWKEVKMQHAMAWPLSILLKFWNLILQVRSSCQGSYTEPFPNMNRLYNAEKTHENWRFSGNLVVVIWSWKCTSDIQLIVWKMAKLLCGAASTYLSGWNPYPSTVPNPYLWGSHRSSVWECSWGSLPLQPSSGESIALVPAKAKIRQDLADDGSTFHVAQME